MGKRLKHQRRGKGGSTFRAKLTGINAEYISLDKKQGEGVLSGQLVDLVKESGRNSILAKILFENNEAEFTIASEGMVVGQGIQYGKNAELGTGNVLPLSSIPEGCPIFNIEKEPGDGGRFARSSGTYALLVSKSSKCAVVKMPSGKTMQFNPNVRATIGCSAAGGRTEKPLVKASSNFYKMLSKSRPWPVVRGVAMNAVSHPFGGEQHHPGKSKSMSRHKKIKVGAIASKRTGRRKKN